MTNTIEDIKVYQEKVEALEQMLSMTTNYMSDIERDLKQKKQKLEQAQKEIYHSLNYGALLQQIIQPNNEKLKSTFSSHFLINNPKDTVGGDFLWMRQKANMTYLACIDCTGHGIPGAMLTMGANFSLNAVFEERDYRSPAELLKSFNERFFKQFKLHQNDQRTITQGLDVSMLIIDHKNHIIRHCGTNQMLLKSNNDQLKIYRGNRSYIGTENPDLSEEHEIKVVQGDAFFVYTDGISDQFGGPRNKKIQHKKIHHMIQSITGLNLNKQGEIILSIIKDWQGNREQTDDMLMFGFKM